MHMHRHTQIHAHVLRLGVAAAFLTPAFHLGSSNQTFQPSPFNITGPNRPL